MKKHIVVIAGLLIFLVSSCATQSIKQGKDLSSSGIAYTKAVSSLLDVATDRLIEFDTEELKKTRYGSNLRERIIQKNEAVTNVLAEIAEFRAHTKLLETYFLNLQALADSPVKNDAGSAVEALSGSISNFSEALGGRKILTDEQKKQIGALGGLVAHTIHGAKIKRALKRDAEVIAVYLILQERQLKIIAGMLQDRFNAENDLFLEEKVIAPYIDTKQAVGADWAANRRQWFKAQFVSQQLVTAQEAAKQLRGVWADILQGKTDINSLSVLISDINEFVTTVRALEAAGESD
jgi:hypothetical protein